MLPEIDFFLNKIVDLLDFVTIVEVTYKLVQFVQLSTN